MSNIVVVSNENIVRLQSEAQAFSHAFYVLFNSFISKEGCQKWNQEGDIMSVLGTNGVFALELYFKFMMVTASFNRTTMSGEHIKGHKLDELYNGLNGYDSNYINDLENLFQNSKYNKGDFTLLDFLESIKKQFEEWRYSYDSSFLTVNLNNLSDLLNILEDYSRNKFLPVSFAMAESPVMSSNSGQTMSIYEIDDIKSEFFL